MTATLSQAQASALFDILTHYDTYAEIREFRHPGSLKHYGPPFSAEPNDPSTAPALQSLVSKFLLTLPGLKDLSSEFWQVQCYEIIENFEKANLSESYDKGAIGSRKTVSTAISVLLEYVVRGSSGGFRKIEVTNHEYDLQKSDDLHRAFRDFLLESVYGNYLDDLVKKSAQTDKLEDFDSLTKAVHEYVLINLASLMHYTLILSPKGQYILKLIDHANKLIPYMLIKQTLRIGNVASMINAMTKVVLAKVSVASITNWIGITASQDEGMNLMQQIISTVLNWDVKELENRATKIEKEEDRLKKDQLKRLKEYACMSADEQGRIRTASQNDSISIAVAVLQDAKLESGLDDASHKNALEYLSIHLSVRDRKEIINVLCHSSPDHLTQSVRELVDAYEPVIRHMHKAIDLSVIVGDAEHIIRDMIKLAKVQTGKDGHSSSTPTVGDFVELLRKHQHVAHSLVHQCCKNGKELTKWYLDWAKHTAAQFRRDADAKDHEGSPSDNLGAGNLTEPLMKIFSELPKDQQDEILVVLDHYFKHIEETHAASSRRLDNVLRCPPSKNPAISKIIQSSAGGLWPISRPSSRASSRAPSRSSSPARPPPSNSADNTTAPIIDPTSALGPSTNSSGSTPVVSSDPGPGAYLTRWQDLLDKTPITPLTTHDAIHRASSPKIVQASAKDVTGEQMVEFGEEEAKGAKIHIPFIHRTDQDKSKHEKDQNDKIDKEDNQNTQELDDGAKANKSPSKRDHTDITIVVDAMGKQFRELLAKRECNW